MPERWAMLREQHSSSTSHCQPLHCGIYLRESAKQSAKSETHVDCGAPLYGAAAVTVVPLLWKLEGLN